MSKGIEVPEFVFDIPADAPPEQQLYMRAQIIVQSAFHTFGDREAVPAAATLDRAELTKAVAMALAMLLVSNRALKTRRDLRLESEKWAKYVAGLANAMHDGGDDPASKIFQALGMWTTEGTA
ncbi:hypothetical protein [Novosphingobium sp. Gsoil 351]|uniref:hypothetical protein n=1 Tax=Novosphingobium sp. Gsoil 351 TaxID=2675225 RepID=UPI0012B48C1B|nr:hypothetical protein [Novosphingobium sp. Gsoil 351]QGN54069.1 hypothetical protein GKE62_05455 [Novosphingobium sp. Gsoil 351]